MGLADSLAPSNAAQAQTNVTPITSQSTTAGKTASAPASGPIADAKSALRTGVLYVVVAVVGLILASRFLNDVRIG